ncbi:MAG TPA: molybdopterin-dependent oxidoreductase [Bryobacteraceae bacterium]
MRHTKPCIILRIGGFVSGLSASPLKEYGAPLRLRVEDQLGYKMVKWIERIEFIESETAWRPF